MARGSHQLRTSGQRAAAGAGAGEAGSRGLRSAAPPSQKKRHHATQLVDVEHQTVSSETNIGTALSSADDPHRSGRSS